MQTPASIAKSEYKAILGLYAHLQHSIIEKVRPSFLDELSSSEFLPFSYNQLTSLIGITCLASIGIFSLLSYPFFHSYLQHGTYPIPFPHCQK